MGHSVEPYQQHQGSCGQSVKKAIKTSKFPITIGSQFHSIPWGCSIVYSMYCIYTLVFPLSTRLEKRM